MGKTLALGVWEERGREGRLLLSELFHPYTFLKALRQQMARFVYRTALYKHVLYSMVFL